MLPAGRSCLLPCSLIIFPPCLKRDCGRLRCWKKARNRPRVVLRHTLAALGSIDSLSDGAHGWEKGGDHRRAAQDGLGGATEGAEGILRGCNTTLKLQRAVPGMPEAPGSQGIPAPRGFVQRSERLGAPCWWWQDFCAVQGHLGATLRSPVLQVTLQGPRGFPWLFWERLPGTTMGTVVSGSFKPDFKSQVTFKKPIQFFSLRGTDLLPRRLRKGLADLLWVPQ